MKMKEANLPMVLLLLLLSMIILSSIEGQQCFQSIQDITNHPVHGEWQDDHNYNHLIRRPPTDCPIPSLYTCYEYEKGAKVTHRYYKQNDCDLKEFDPLSFLSTFRHRKLLMVGDSVTGQFWTMIVCSLHGITHVEYEITHDVVSHRGIDEGKAFYKEYNFTLIFFLTQIKYNQANATKQHLNEDCNNLNDFLVSSNISSPLDMVVMNIGLHQPHAAKYLPLVKKYIEQYSLMNPLTRPILLWRETTPQHFDWRDEDVPMGYHNTLTKDPVCYEYPNYTLAYTQDFRNRLAELIMRKYNIPIMRIYNATRTEFDSHIAKPRDRPYTDCTHFCQESGVYYYMRDLFYNIVPVLMKHREEELEELKKKGMTDVSYHPQKSKFAISTQG